MGRTLSMKRRVLIAEDSERTREQLRTLLAADERLDVEVTGDGNAALELLADDGYSLCLTDLQMPGLHGMKLIEQVRAKQIPVTMVVMTAHARIDQAVQATRMGAFGFLTKPVDPDHLRLVIDQALRERSRDDEL